MKTLTDLLAPAMFGWRKSADRKLPPAGLRGVQRRFAPLVGAVLALPFATGLFPAAGGTVITSNLPSNTAIINIDARADGAASYNGDQSLWYHPFNTGGTLLQYTVQAGTYGFRVINPSDAVRLFPALTAAQTNQIYTAWTYNSPWIEDYLVFDSAAATNSSLAQIFDGDPEWPPYGNATDAYSATVTNGTYDQIRVGPLGRDSTNIVYSYTFTNAETLIFVVPDYALGDNAGGVSVVISPVSAAPLLAASPGADKVTFQWSTNYPGFILSQTTNLQNAIWSDVTAPQPVVVNDHFSVALPLDSTANRFFRLHKP
ncbi:MAG: hypothetical protein KGJ60_11535 [Verrucomicrobiota bacterium]|nr:hypothetical protein [Verrucomicrobiota bacterium]